MEAEDSTPQGENRTLAEALEAIELASGNNITEIGLDLAAPGFGLDLIAPGFGLDLVVSSTDTSPSIEEDSTNTLPQHVTGRSREVAGEDKMSQSYHEIFESQLPRNRQSKNNKSVDIVDGRGCHKNIKNVESLGESTVVRLGESAAARLGEGAAAWQGDSAAAGQGESAAARLGEGAAAWQRDSAAVGQGESAAGRLSEGAAAWQRDSAAVGQGESAAGRLSDPSSVTSPVSDDRLGSEHSGSTETGQPVIPQGEVYLRDGRLVCEVDTENTTQYLTSKLVADSIMWQQTFRNDSPSPEDVLEHTSSSSHTQPTNTTQLKRVNSIVDPTLIEDVERQARRLATDVDNVVENLACVLQSISAITVETVETYRDGVCKTCDAVDDNIKGMYQLMAKWEELNKSMGPAYRLSSQIKDIKKLLDVMELALPNP